eukprot:scaffold11287_cov88-Skeletonema_marinoi.AAC.1
MMLQPLQLKLQEQQQLQKASTSSLPPLNLKPRPTSKTRNPTQAALELETAILFHLPSQLAATSPLPAMRMNLEATNPRTSPPLPSRIRK